NGNLVAKRPYYLSVAKTTEPFTIGELIPGKIDEVKLWNRALSEQEINASYNAGLYRLERNFTDLSVANLFFRGKMTYTHVTNNSQMSYLDGFSGRLKKKL
ncbi:MAG: hypothetical protein DRQ02_13315, partial [Candidatus Latescibacterota bacterium]